MDGCIRCNQPDTLALSASEAKWGNASLSYFLNIVYPGVDSSRIAFNYRKAASQLEAVCGVRFTEVASSAQANIVAVSGMIDGPWNVLALSQLPNSSSYAGVLNQTFDQAEQLSDDLMVAMMCHELGHILGLGHLGTGNLMAPILDARITKPQAGDIAELVSRYGLPLPQTTPVVSTASFTAANTGVISLTISGLPVQAGVTYDVSITPASQ
ncbi:matrixin family metalloprotease [Singulisphaera sp. PoT]|uniref:matrixin family metalloprotease n=1 Tax=Singulisphaera sp. PoT TaxID=3411797 RepID=UPI003BF4C3B8